MTRSSNPARTCKHCGGPIRSDGAGEVCDACLIQEGLVSGDSQLEESVDTALPGDADSGLVSQGGGPAMPDKLEGGTVGPGGRYRILQRIGEGGFGMVYMAEQTEPVRRRVALKILKAGMDTRQVVARFEAERQALAMMDHPNIAKILDGGETDQGRPFFVMELVRGTPITKYCDREQLDTGARLGLFLQVCQAVQHAHQKGIIHRDLKPSNILITAPDGAEPVPKVIDFGVAKALENNLTDKTLFTRFEQMIGTPAYMSPEQAGSEGGIDVDTRADIYALGVLLYELLSGSTPIETSTLQNAAFEEVRRILREEEAPRPSARLSSLAAERRSTIATARGTGATGLGKLLRGDLDWIVMKAIEKDRRRRYDTANALAEDVERHLADEPVNAGPPTAGYRIGKYLRRHKAPLAIGATVALLLIAGITATSWQAIRATKEKNRALQAEEHVEERLREAEAISEFITGLFETANPESEEGRRTMTVEESLKIAEGRLEKADDIPEERRATLNGAIAKVYFSLGRDYDALRLRTSNVERLRNVYGNSDPATITAMRELADTLARAKMEDESLLTTGEAALGLSREVHGERHPETIKAMHTLAHCYTATYRHEDACGLLATVVAASRDTLGPAHRETLKATHCLALTSQGLGQTAEARELLEDALRLSRKTLGEQHPETLKILASLAKLLPVDEGIEILKEESMTMESEKPFRLDLMIDLSDTLRMAGRFGEALEIAEEAVALSKSVFGETHPQTLRSLAIVASCYKADTRVEEAIQLFERVLTRCLPDEDLGLSTTEPPPAFPFGNSMGGPIAEVGRGRPRLGVKFIGGVVLELVNAYQETGRIEEMVHLVKEQVLPILQKVLERKRLLHGGDHPETLLAMRNLSIVCYAAGLSETAIPFHVAWLEQCRETYGSEHTETADAMYILSIDMCKADRKAEAIPLLEQLVGQGTEFLSGGHLLDSMQNLALSYEAHGQGVEALEVREEALKLSRKVNGRNSEQTRAALNDLGNSYHGHERNEDALEVRLEQLEVSRQLYGEDHPTTGNAKWLLANAYEVVGQLDEAAKLRGPGHLPVQADSPTPTSVLVSPPSKWRWLHPVNGVDPTEANPDFHRTFYRFDFDDSGWHEGIDDTDEFGGFGYGDDWFTGVDIGGPAVKGLSKAAYFRHQFTTDKPFRNLELRCQRDDGIVVYLDGKEVGRGNMRQGEESFELGAESSVGRLTEKTVFRLPLDDAGLAPGEHVLAISLHNTENPSSDLRIGEISLVEVQPQKAEDGEPSAGDPPVVTEP